MSATAEEIVLSIIRNPSLCEDGELVNDLLREYHRGGSVDSLRVLLNSGVPAIEKVGVWLASELGQAAAPLVNDITQLLHHELRYVRYYALDALLTCTSTADAAALLEVLTRFGDPDRVVRQKLMHFLSRLHDKKLDAMLLVVERCEIDPLHLTGLKTLVSAGHSNVSVIKAALDSTEPLLRKYGVAAAARSTGEREQLLRYAATLTDDDIGAFAKEELDWIAWRRKGRNE